MWFLCNLCVPTLLHFQFNLSDGIVCVCVCVLAWFPYSRWLIDWSIDLNFDIYMVWKAFEQLSQLIAFERTFYTVVNFLFIGKLLFCKPIELYVIINKSPKKMLQFFLLSFWKINRRGKKTANIFCALNFKMCL